MAKSVTRFTSAHRSISMPWREMSLLRTKARPVVEKLEGCIAAMGAFIKQGKAVEKAVKKVNDGQSSSELDSSYEIPVDEGTRKMSNNARCLYCGGNETQLPRHMRMMHSQEADVAQILALTGNSPETILQRRRMWGALRARGDHIFQQTRNRDRNVPAIKYQMSQNRVAAMTCCPYCKYEFARTYINDHIKYRCAERLTSAMSAEATSQQQMTAGMSSHEITTLSYTEVDIWRYFVHLIAKC